MIRRDLGVYLHIPFCLHKCDYCDFLSHVPGRAEKEYYFRYLTREIESYRPLADLYRIRTVYLGGGTPSAAPAEKIAQTMDLLRSQFSFSPDAEITIEVNPGTTDEDSLRVYRGAGINRLSIGLQSADNDELKTLGRIHTYEDFLQTYRMARAGGWNNINVDLISALPGQTADSWVETLKKVVLLKPEHISAYSLMIEEGTPFAARYGTPEGRRSLPSEEEDRRMYRLTREILRRCGYERYEISNYARKGRECRHNTIYWTGREYLGFGLGAASYLGMKRFRNPDRMGAYIKSAGDAFSRCRLCAQEPEKRAMEEFMFLGLRMMRGISDLEFETRFHVSFERVYGHTVKSLIRRGYLEEKGNRICLTERGIDVSNVILAEFLL